MRLIALLVVILTLLSACERAEQPDPKWDDADRLASSLVGQCWDSARRGDLDQALSECDRAIEIDPTLAWAYINRAYVHNESGRYDLAIRDCDRALALDPTNATAYVNRGFAWNQNEDFDRALTDSQAALRLDPDNAAALINRGHAWHEKGEYRQALEDCNRAVLADPSYVLAFNSLAYLLATCPDRSIRDGRRAVEMASRALAMDPENPMIWDTLAMSLAEAGRPAQAVETQRRAIELLDRVGTPKERYRRDSYVEHLEELEKRLEKGGDG